MPQALQIARVMTNVRSLKTSLEKYSHLVALQARRGIATHVGLAFRR